MVDSVLNVAVLGASGYAGADAVRLLLGHPRVRLVALGADTKAGLSYADIYPHLGYAALPRLTRAQDIAWDAVDVVFGCLPHGASEEILKGLVGGDRIVIDHSADFRLKDPATYAAWYGRVHTSPELLAGAVYGLTEFARPQLRTANLIAAPGCYPTATLLALRPLLGAGVIGAQDIVIDAKSGVSGAGRALKEANLFCEIGESTHAYGLGHHRHMPEIEQELTIDARSPVTVSFTPHLLPMSRGELVTSYVRLTPGATVADLRRVLVERYAEEPFVHVAPEGLSPATRHVRGSNHCLINVFADRLPGRAIVISTIDNLVKGTAGQAIQDLNVRMGWQETLGLTQAPLFP
jgi:N-acetyl-gamma-glutamyl-phosphate reductase